MKFASMPRMFCSLSVFRSQTTSSFSVVLVRRRMIAIYVDMMVCQLQNGDKVTFMSLYRLLPSFSLSSYPLFMDVLMVKIPTIMGNLVLDPISQFNIIQEQVVAAGMVEEELQDVVDQVVHHI